MQNQKNSQYMEPNTDNDMGVIATDKREINFYYSSNSSIGKQTLGYIRASDKKILEIDVAKTPLTGTQWVELADRLGCRVEDLIDRDHPDFIKHYGKNVDLGDEHEWLKLLEKEPDVFQHPIIINGDESLQIVNPSDVSLFLDEEDREEQKDLGDPRSRNDR